MKNVIQIKKLNYNSMRFEIETRKCKYVELNLLINVYTIFYLLNHTLLKLSP